MAQAKEQLRAPETPDAAARVQAKGRVDPKATSQRTSEASTAIDSDVTKKLTTRLTPNVHKTLKTLVVDRETTSQALVRGMGQALLKRLTS